MAANMLQTLYQKQSAQLTFQGMAQLSEQHLQWELLRMGS